MSSNQKRKVFIDTYYRNDQANTLSNNCIIPLSGDVRDLQVKGFVLSDFVFSNDLYPINSNHSSFYYYENDNAITYVDMDVGSYSITDAMAQLLIKIEANTFLIPRYFRPAIG